MSVYTYFTLGIILGIAIQFNIYKKKKNNKKKRKKNKKRIFFYYKR